jgi:hypothetical protein
MSEIAWLHQLSRCHLSREEWFGESGIAGDFGGVYLRDQEVLYGQSASFVASRRSRSFVSNSLASKPYIAAEGGWEGVCSNGLKHECERSARGPYDRAPVEESERQQNQRSDHGFQHNGGNKLHPTAENGDEAKNKECDYILLTQIVDPKAHPEEPQIPPISIGGKVPSVDASDPLGGSSGPVYRDNVQISFALFHTDRFEAIVDTVILAQPSGHASDNLLSAMDKESNRVGHELKKK